MRAEGFEGRLVLVGAERRLPYDRPPLSKEILRGQWEPDRIALRKDGEAGYESLDLDLRLGRRATALDPRAKTVTLDGGETLAYDGLIIATGSAPRRLRGTPPDLEGVFVLRTLDDALALRAAFERGPRVVVVGAGFIGAEVAASCRQIGLDVTVVEPQAAPLVHGLGEAMGRVCAELHRNHGVDLRCGVGVEAIEGQRRVERVRLGDGTTIDADVVVVGIGVHPETAWLESSGLALDDGVVCDATCATAAPGVVAAGDVARWYNPLFDETMRVEHWTNAVEQGVAAAKRLLADFGEPAGERGVQAYAPVPLFWSDQHGVKIQFAGRARSGDEVRVVHGDPADFKFVALYGRAGKLTGVLAFRRPRYVVEYMDLIAARTSWDDAIAHAAGT